MVHEIIERRSFVIALVLVSIAFLVLIKPFYIPIFWACAVAMIFYPVYQRLLTKAPKWPNMMALVTLLLCAVLVVLPVLAITSAFVEEAVNLYQRIQSGEINPAHELEVVRAGIPGISSLIERIGIDFEELKSRLLEVLMSAGSLIAKNALTLGQKTGNFFLMLGLMLYLTFFLLRDGEKLVNVLIRALPLGDEREHLLLAKIGEVTRATIKGNLVVAITQGTLGGLIFWALDLPAPLLWGVVMTLLSLLPAVGAALIWFPAAIYLYSTGDIFKGTILMAFGLMVISLIDNLLRPILVGRDTKLPDYLVLFSTIGGLMMFGISGFAIGPLLAALFLAFWQIFMREFINSAEEQDF